MTNPFTNQYGTGLDANGGLLPGYKYMTYSNGVGQGTPVQIGSLGAGGQTVTSNVPPSAGSYNPNITAGPQTQAAPSTANMPSFQMPQMARTMKQQTGWGNQQTQQWNPSQWQQSPFQYQNNFQQSPYGQAFNTQGFNRSNQGGLLSGGNFAFGNPFGNGLLNY